MLAELTTATTQSASGGIAILPHTLSPQPRPSIDSEMSPPRQPSTRKKKHCFSQIAELSYGKRVVGQKLPRPCCEPFTNMAGAVPRRNFDGLERRFLSHCAARSSLIDLHSFARLRREAAQVPPTQFVQRYLALRCMSQLGLSLLAPAWLARLLLRTPPVYLAQSICVCTPPIAI